MKTQYTITHHTHGITVTGQTNGHRGVSVTLLGRLIDAYPEYPIADAKVGQALGVVLALTSEEGSEKWRDELDLG